MSAQATMPNGFRAVTQEEFFRLLSATPEDIMPTTESPNQTWWRNTRTREAWGWCSWG